MDLPTEIVDAVADAASVASPPRNTRSAQRRRAAIAAPDAASAAPVVADPVVIETPAVSASVPIEAEPTVSLPSNPPAAVMADIIAEEHVMDINNTAETVSNTAEQMAGRGQAAFTDLSGRAKEAMEKGSRMAEELGSFGKGNLEAMVESSKIAVKGFESLGQEAAEFTRRSFESATAAMKTLAATRSPTEFMKLQSDYARSMFDTLVAETSKSTELMMKLANDVAQPLSNRVAVAAEKIKIAA